jgi:hypothetical protein
VALPVPTANGDSSMGVERKSKSLWAKEASVVGNERKRKIMSEGKLAPWDISKKESL